MKDADLLDLVQPSDGWFAVVGIKGKRDVKQELVATRGEVDQLVEEYVAEQRNVFFGVAKYATGDNRTKENVKALKAFWLDIDCGPDKAEIDPDTGRPGGYSDQRAGLNALRDFCKVVGLPKPTLVNSGGGIHAYWPLDKEVPRKEWEAIAERFKQVCRTQNFYVDDKVFEVARVLRIPGTYNFKQDEPRPVALLYGGASTTVDQLRSVFGVSAQTVSPLFDDNWQPSERAQAMQRSVGYSFKRIMRRTAEGDGCAQLLHAYKNRATVGYYEWFYALSVAALCEDADKATHMLSAGHSGYDPEEVDRKVATIRKATSCAKFRSTKPELCEGCPHLGRIMGPKDLGKELKIAPEGSVFIANEAGEEELFTVPKMPFPYFRGEGPGVWRKADKDSESQDPIWVYEHDLYVLKIMDDPIEGNVAMFRLHLPHGITKEFAVSMFKVTQKDELRKALSAKGVICMNKKFDLLMDYVSRALQEIQYREREQIMRQQFGWADNNSKFIIGDQEISVDGVSYSPPSKTTRPIAKFMGPVGSLEKWKEVWRLYGKEGLEPQAFAALSAFGSPLLRYLHQTGAVINLFNSRSGTGKTTVLNMINSVYGHPKELRLKQDDTPNGRLQWVGILNNLPATMDELTNMGPNDYSDFLYALSNGKGKERMQAGTNELRENNTTWQSITVASSNASFAEKLSIIKKNPEGELMRLIEYPVNKVTALNTLEAKQMFDRDLFANYGHAGPIYARYLLENMERTQRMCDQLQAKIDRELQLEPKERFWSATMAANISGGIIAHNCGLLLDWDMNNIYQYACSLIDDLRRNGNAPVDNVRQVVADYLYRNMQNILVVNGKADRRTNMQSLPKREPKGELLVRIEPDTKRMFIIANSFKEYCVKFQLNYSDTVRKLETEGRIIKKKSVRLSKGTAVNGEPIHCLWFNIDDDFVHNEYIGDEGEEEKQTEDVG